MKLFDLFEMKYNLGAPRLNIDNDFVRYMRSKLPNFPDYVLRDWLKENYANKEEFDQAMIDSASWTKGPLDKIQWTKEPQILEFKMKMFDENTLRWLDTRKDGKIDPFGIPKDVERHQIQANLIKGKNPKKDVVVREPVILFRHGKKYELIEGWHRTIQAFKHYPDGYKGYAYIGKPGR